MEDGVDVVEDILRAECRGQVAVAVGYEFQAEAGGEGGDEIGIEVGDTAILARIPARIIQSILS